MDNTAKDAEDVRHVEGVTKGTQTTWRKIVPMKPNAQTTKKSFRIFKILWNIQMRGKIIELKYLRNITFLNTRKIVEFANEVQKMSSISISNTLKPPPPQQQQQQRSAL